jgi:hypothetical protein
VAGRGLFLTRLETYSTFMRVSYRAQMRSHCNKTWNGRVDPVEPGHDELCLLT